VFPTAGVDSESDVGERMSEESVHGAAEDDNIPMESSLSELDKLIASLSTADQELFADAVDELQTEWKAAWAKMSQYRDPPEYTQEEVRDMGDGRDVFIYDDHDEDYLKSMFTPAEVLIYNLVQKHSLGVEVLKDIAALVKRILSDPEVTSDSIGAGIHERFQKLISVNICKFVYEFGYEFVYEYYISCL
jgi:hypothetical protein